ncbi:hypothetical protein GIW56_02515 [Pseudomonas gessardii]|uniref:Uncharacterized protein n=1 Tax=Pseudomonas gessardii TaxID=78544 RepID=A0ABS9EZV0_9PSED|nr:MULTISPECIES: hypothetical protein [Pseudomonadaceae]MCF4988761.1 hypothetical protein [Pseudomonas gessardii]MCF5097839.1 hypothetical protein [Pseudomonas gessardii]MCF5105700.1 hypothetical protein [Pseudomonas gessardii]MCQ4322291.1 hypothetical protein [Stutzerimonas stutzeri]
MHSNTEFFPSIQARAGFEASAVVHAHKTGVNPVELDSLAQAIGRLARDHSTVVSESMRGDLREFENLGYIELVNTTSATVTVELLCASALLSSYFWSVWVPRHLLSCSLKVAVMSHLQHPAQVQHCSVVFRVPGSREATRQFLHELGTKFPGDQAEIIAIQAGNVLADKDAAL